MAWNGLVSVDEKDTGSLDITQYFDGQRSVIMQESGEFEASISAFTYPDDISETVWYKRFGFSYRTQHADAYRIHLVYNALVKPTSRAWSSINSSPGPTLFSWDMFTSPVLIPGARPAAHLILDSLAVPEVTEALESRFYGTDATEPEMPSPSEIIDIYEAVTTLKIVYNSDGSWTVDGPDGVVIPFPDGTFQISSPSAAFLDEDTFTVHSS